ncbi:hypothetical protein LINGRAHAP2_LOCUS14891 [Linum grandiflorum]
MRKRMRFRKRRKNQSSVMFGLCKNQSNIVKGVILAMLV